MNVVFDAQVFSFQEYGGISQYFSRLLKHFQTMEGITPELLIRWSNNVYLSEFPSLDVRPFFPGHRFKGRNEIIKLLNRAYVRRHFPSTAALRIVHPTYYDPYIIDMAGDAPLVLTIFDMAHERYPHMFSRFDYSSANKNTVAQRAKKIIAISEHTKKDIVELLSIPESRIDVIPLATTISVDEAQKPSSPLPSSFILFVGKRYAYKNFSVLLQAFSRLAGKQSSLFLVCAGGGPFSSAELDEMRALSIQDRTIQLTVKETTLAYLYANARAFIYPSLYEGFGIPVLEAFTCGSPAVLSNRSSLPEVGGDAACYFDPEDPASLISVLSEVLDNADFSSTLRTRGKERAKLFSWEHTARQTFKTYTKVLSQTH